MRWPQKMHDHESGMCPRNKPVVALVTVRVASEMAAKKRYLYLVTMKTYTERLRTERTSNN